MTRRDCGGGWGKGGERVEMWGWQGVMETGYINHYICVYLNIVQKLCESGGGRPGLSVLTSLLVSVDV